MSSGKYGTGKPAIPPAQASTPAEERTDENWKLPPVVEVVLGVQFDPLPQLTNGHLGWFWGEQHSEYPHSDDVPSVDQAIELGGEGEGMPMPMFRLRPAAGDARLRMISADGTRMIQVQNGWLVANWMKGDQGYPGYKGVREQFERALARFCGFLAARGLGEVSPNLWEVTYIDHIVRGTVWQDVAEVPGVLPGLLGRHAHVTYESVRGTWTFPIRLKPGRLRVEVQMGHRRDEPHDQLIIVTSTARGPITGTPDHLEEHLNAGHIAAVETFRAITSAEAQSYWKGARG